jgi:hypothetical protein
VIVQQAAVPGREIMTPTLGGRALRFRFEDEASGAFGSDVGPWVERAAAIARYKRVFVAYRLFGAKSLLRKTKLGRSLPGLAASHLGLPLAGWFDTHAARSTAWAAPTFASNGEL